VLAQPDRPVLQDRPARQAVLVQLGRLARRLLGQRVQRVVGAAV
jgi:hypothetical protein